MAGVCYVRECDRAAKRDGLCWGHYKRRQRRAKGGRSVPLSEPLGDRRTRYSEHDSPFGRLVSAATALADLRATDDAGWERARDRLRKAAIAYARSLSGNGQRPPSTDRKPEPTE